MAVNKFFKFILSLAALSPVCVFSFDESSPVWGYECNENKKCIKVPFNNEYNSQSLTLCRMLCGEEIGTLWPKPSGPVKIGEFVIPIDRTKIKFQIIPKFINNKIWEKVKERFTKQIDAKIPEYSLARNQGKLLMIRINLGEIDEEVPKLTYETDESYVLKIKQQDKNQVLAEINAPTYFGARHGLETLAQLIVFNDIGRCVEILVDTVINDAPIYKHRGILLDTARNYFSVKAIKRTLDGMAMSKLNTFHWHMVDSNSFPLVVNSHPDLHKFGAYAPHKIYTPANITEVVEYALVRGIRVIPELDGPAHIGEGWQKKNVTVCFKAQPWKMFCNEPPCGQLDPTLDRVYDLLEEIYSEMLRSFDANIFHMGGDTASLTCWNSTQSIQNWMGSKGWSLDVRDFVNLWGYFQTNALARLDKALTSDVKIPIILWASQLTTPPYIDEFLDKSRYIIQTVANTPEEFIQEALKRGFRLISTNFDLFINSDAANWNGGVRLDGWRKFYENMPDRMFGGPNKLILGSEAALWSEQIDEFTLDSLLWPKASALAERLWSNPKESWRNAENRLLMHREHLVQNGLTPEALQPEWCVQNQNECPRDTCT